MGAFLKTLIFVLIVVHLSVIASYGIALVVEYPATLSIPLVIEIEIITLVSIAFAVGIIRLMIFLERYL